jgi:hypothetical protein
VHGPAADDSKGWGEFGQVISVGGERVDGVGDQVGELARRDAA